MTTTESSTRPATSDDRPILVIGASGKTGRRVADQLAALDLPVRRASRSSATRFDWQDATTWAPALAGARSAYTVPPEEPVDVDRFATEAAAAGLDRVVLLSARQPDQAGDGVIPGAEAALTAGDLPVTIVRPAWFSQNFTEGLFVDELAGGVLRLPVGDGREPFIDADDIAAVAVAALTSDKHDGAHDLSGPELLSFGEAVDRLAAATGRELRFEPVDPQVWADAAGEFLPPPVVGLLSNLFAAIRRGDNAYRSTGVEDVLGRAPRSFDRAVAPNGS